MTPATHAPESPLGYTCPCGAFHPAGAWDAAHWTEILGHTCAVCGRENELHCGTVLKSRLPKPSRSKQVQP